jgi:cytochrome c553
VAISVNAIADHAATAVAVILLVTATLVACACHSALAAQPTSMPPTTAAEPPPVAPVRSVASSGVTLRSVNINLPGSNRTFPGGAEADAINNDCLICHSAGMVLTQPSLPRAAWAAEVEKMRNFYKAPIAPKDVPAIVDYLTKLGEEMAQPPRRQPDVMRGAVIVAQGTTAGAPPCAQCHAFNGVSDGSGAFPRIAGQSIYYLAAQMHDYASGVRINAIMSPIVRALSPDDIADVSAYYSRIDAPFPPLKAPDAALVKQGEKLAKLGDAARKIQSCDRCHGPVGEGESPAIPYLDGQYAHYIAFTLHQWQQGYRNSSPDAMEVMAKKLDEQDTAAVAAYYQQVRSQPRGDTAALEGSP